MLFDTLFAAKEDVAVSQIVVLARVAPKVHAGNVVVTCGVSLHSKFGVGAL